MAVRTWDACFILLFHHVRVQLFQESWVRKLLLVKSHCCLKLFSSSIGGDFHCEEEEEYLRWPLFKASTWSAAGYSYTFGGGSSPPNIKCVNMGCLLMRFILVGSVLNHRLIWLHWLLGTALEWCWWQTRDDRRQKELWADLTWLALRHGANLFCVAVITNRLMRQSN